MNTRHAFAVLVLIAAASCARVPAPAPRTPPAQPAPPALVVQIVVDQFRADYIERYGTHWTGGLHRLATEGAHFVEAAYPYAGTFTCAGHASVGTGAVPADHGMVANAWWDRAAKRRLSCTTDTGVTPIGLTATAKDPHSARWMMRPTFADRLDAAHPESRIVTFALKARSAIGLAGHGGDAVTWFEDTTFTTSSAYGRAPWLVDYLKAHPIEARSGATWSLLRPRDTYQGTDDDPGTRAPETWTTSFPHTLVEAPAGPFYDRWEQSPFSDAYVADLAMEAIDQLELGKQGGTDYLGVSFSALDLVGHTFGPESWEVQDMLAHLDVTLGRLIAHLDAKVGPGNYVLGLTADHGAAPVPERYEGRGGRVLTSTIRETVEGALDAAFGAADYVDDVYETEIYFSEQGRARLAEGPAALAVVDKALRTLPGVSHIMTAAARAAARQAADPELRAFGLSYRPDRSGDLLVVLDEFFIPTRAATTHGTVRAYDRRVPVILFGGAFTPGKYDGPASPLDLAPTWATLTGITLPQAYGRSLDRAIR
jgi:predicted AlkP superfamily pyrophosphatase or phosphodiesterase